LAQALKLAACRADIRAFQLRGVIMTDNPQPITAAESTERKTYSAPAIVHDLKLETRAGSPLRTGLTDPLGIDPTQPQAN
jgi:hypothetical protein